jgi:hypothetical protein
LLDDGDGVNPSTIAGEVAVDLCEECSQVAQMLRDYETSPLPKCDIDAATWSSAELTGAFAGGDVDLAGGSSFSPPKLTAALLYELTTDQRRRFTLYCTG